MEFWVFLNQYSLHVWIPVSKKTICPNLEVEVGAALEDDGAGVEQPGELLRVVAVEGEPAELPLLPEALEHLDPLLEVPPHLVLALGGLLGVVLQLEPERRRQRSYFLVWKSTLKMSE